VEVVPEVAASDVARHVAEHETEVASNDPDIAAVVTEQDQPSTLSPIRDWSAIRDERIFPAMNCVKNKLRNKMGDQYLNDCLVTFIECEMFVKVKECDIIIRFQAMKESRIKATLAMKKLNRKLERLCNFLYVF
jgi:hypothetical protein